MIDARSTPRWLETLMTLEEKAWASGAVRVDLRLARLLMKNDEKIFTIPDGPCFDHEPNWIRRIRVLHPAGPGRFWRVQDIDSGEMLSIHETKLRKAHNGTA